MACPCNLWTAQHFVDFVTSSAFIGLNHPTVAESLNCWENIAILSEQRSTICSLLPLLFLSQQTQRLFMLLDILHLQHTFWMILGWWCFKRRLSVNIWSMRKLTSWLHIGIDWIKWRLTCVCVCLLVCLCCLCLFVFVCVCVLLVVVWLICKVKTNSTTHKHTCQAFSLITFVRN